MVAPNYAQTRSALAKSMGLGNLRQKAKQSASSATARSPQGDGSERHEHGKPEEAVEEVPLRRNRLPEPSARSARGSDRRRLSCRRRADRRIPPQLGVGVAQAFAPLPLPSTGARRALDLRPKTETCPGQAASRKSDRAIFRAGSCLERLFFSPNLPLLPLGFASLAERAWAGRQDRATRPLVRSTGLASAEVALL